MKHCPQCQTSYTDGTLKFCLQDGTPLVETSDTFSASSTGAQTVVFGNTNIDNSNIVDSSSNDQATVISPRKVEPIHIPIQQTQPLPPQNPPPPPPPPPQNYTQPQSYRRTEQPPVIAVSPPPPAARKSKTGLALGLTALALLALLGIGALYLMRDKTTDVAATNNVNSSNTDSAPSNRISTAANVNSAINGSAVSIQNQSATAGTVVPTVTATPAPKRTLDAKQARIIDEDVGAVVDNWQSSSENLDMDSHLSNYANTVDYYRGGRVGLSRVRADKERAFGAYNSVKFNISNVKITPDASGERATVVFDKEWNFKGDGKNSSGKVLQQLTLSKIGGRWLITGERDLKTYYINN